ncbi:MAG: heme lyase CcmF/NrfE family subunit [Acidimicrobiia bacterium]|nr:heme lyase CcmF/NrfE family subunit [Acidimicrobiia bacterium]
MIGFIGLLAVWAAVVGSVWLSVAGVAVARDPDRGIDSLRTPVLTIAIAAAVAMAALELGIVTHDFSLSYVADNSSTDTPLVFLLASGWAALEGSIVLWGLVLAVFTWLVWRDAGAGDGLAAGALAVLGVVSVFWFGVMGTIASPFEVCTVAAPAGCAADAWAPWSAAIAPMEGLGPNPLLQNHILMAVHPPLLYLGYVGLTVPFAFAMSALARGDRGTVWLERTRRWSLVAWAFLTAGILLGAWWSYEVLGWGGYWAWDPVENAAFLPWLIATAFLHSAAVQRRRGMLQAWNYTLVISMFLLTILGTFLTRSGVIFSVHSFTQSAIGPTLLVFLAVAAVASFGLFAVRSQAVASAPRLETLASREGVFLANNLLLVLFAVTVLVGTVYPLVLEAFTGRQVSVGRPFFDRATLPVAFALLLAVGIGPITPYRVARGSVVWARVKIPALAGLVSGAIAVLVGVRSVPAVLVVVLGSFVIAVPVATVASQAQKLRRERSWTKAIGRVLAGDRGYWGGQISHIGIALVSIAIATTTALAVRQEVTVDLGQSVSVGTYCVTYEGPFRRVEPNRAVIGTQIRVTGADCSGEGTLLEPRLHQYPNSTQAVATPDVFHGTLDDVYVSLVSVRDETAIVDVYVFPLQRLLWLGGLVTVAGGLYALRARRHTSSAPTSDRPTAPSVIGSGHE